MTSIKRINSKDIDFKNLVDQLDSYLAIIDGKDHDFYNQFNSTKLLHNCIVLHDSGNPIGCGALKRFNKTDFEIKRMFVLPSQRGKGSATQILKELENWAKELGALHCVLETGKRMPDAIALYMKNGYKKIPNYGQYVGIDNSCCFKKKL